jgi:hypothetical protein
MGKLPRDWQAHFYRTSIGAKIDLLDDNRNRPIALEIKYSTPILV